MDARSLLLGIGIRVIEWFVRPKGLERSIGDDEKEYDRIRKAGGAFCESLGPDRIEDGFSEVLGYFMPRKVACGNRTVLSGKRPMVEPQIEEP